jgi:hypothetical protein
MSRLRGCAISTLLRFRPVCTTCFGGGRPLTCRAIFCFVFWPIGFRPTASAIWMFESRRFLDGAGPPEDAGKRAVDSNQLTAEVRPGTMLAREWNGRMHRVAVLADGFAWNGKTYPSLSKIALAITGTRWNGPRFFGLRDKPSKEVRS